MTCSKSLDFIGGFAIDYMHCAMLGVAKLLLKLWLDPSKCRGTLHDLRTDEHKLNCRLKKTKVFSFMTRKP